MAKVDVNIEKPQAHPAPLAGLTTIIENAQLQWKSNPIGSINIIAPNTNQAQIELRALHGESVAHRNVYQTLNFDGVTGQKIIDENDRLNNPSISWAFIMLLLRYTKLVVSI